MISVWVFYFVLICRFSWRLFYVMMHNIWNLLSISSKMVSNCWKKFFLCETGLFQGVKFFRIKFLYTFSKKIKFFMIFSREIIIKLRLKPIYCQYLNYSFEEWIKFYLKKSILEEWGSWAQRKLALKPNFLRNKLKNHSFAPQTGTIWPSNHSMGTFS